MLFLSLFPLTFVVPILQHPAFSGKEKILMCCCTQKRSRTVSHMTEQKKISNGVWEREPKIRKSLVFCSACQVEASVSKIRRYSLRFLALVLPIVHILLTVHQACDASILPSLSFCLEK